MAQELVDGDKLYAQRKNFEKAKMALALFEDYHQKNPKDVEGLWRLSMGHYYVGHLLEGKKNRFRRKEHFRKGVEAGQDCEKYSPKPKVECFFWQGTNLALKKQEHGVLSMAFSLSDIIDLLEKAKKVDGKYASGGAYRTLAILYFKAPGFLGGDQDMALDYIRKAIKISPNEPLNVVFYAKFLKELDREQESITLLKEFVSKAKPDEFPFYESHNAFQEIQYYLKNVAE